ncbi:uncharacterized protein K452DRAFT_297234 [Aplosporella prunicola CBS 121167]|uniref:Carboxylesterase type B domain-containing protein n=1 Tax=Aplosporella prunicola CBS 121167 TaxID=1176127 RepID=A0A6A6BH89_9PEZI|nr:uncharacterized protein K452DRAFT_297234 [Aplosporella prunicola CBS 121167]KAF2143509.1 hypothetical protein K452DRAFT_297234 [Aplosporella prunicola CBS 121167]
MQILAALLLLLAAAVVSAQRHDLPTNNNILASTPTVTLGYCTAATAARNASLGYYKYQNIRFAAVPTVDLRFAKPEWPPVETVLNNGSLADADVDCFSEEDCLYMDIWAPANSEEKKLPVMGLFNLTKDFIFVSYNYRLGITGLANGPTLLHEGGTSNAAIWDVQHAFQWVKKYIGHFGGGSNQVMAVGFSAVGSQRFAGHAEQLFDRAYFMSPGYVSGAGHYHSETFWQNISTSVGYEAQLYRKRFNSKDPFVISHEQHEANSQAYTGINTSEDVAAYLHIFFPAITNDVDEILDLYPEPNYSSPGLPFADIKQSFDLAAKDLAVIQALQSQTWNAMVALDTAINGTGQNYYSYSTSSLSSSFASFSSGSVGGPSGSSNSNTSSNSSSPAGSMGGGMRGSSSVNSTIAIMMQKYLLSFVLAGNPNTKWADDKIHWSPFVNDMQLVFNSTFYLDEDNLMNSRVLYWNRALWY